MEWVGFQYLFDFLYRIVDSSDFDRSSQTPITNEFMLILFIYSSILVGRTGDTCCFSFSLGSFRTFLQDVLGANTYVKSIRIGNNIVEDFESGYFVHPNKQVEEACRQISSDPELQNGYNAIGFSQGAQFLYVYCIGCFDFASHQQQIRKLFEFALLFHTDEL